MKILYPANFGDEYPVEARPGVKLSLNYGHATVRGIKITPEGTEITLFIPVTAKSQIDDLEDIDDEPDPDIATH